MLQARALRHVDPRQQPPRRSGLQIAAMMSQKAGQEDTMKASDIMSSRVVSVAPDATVLEATQLMLENRISGLPVIDQAGTLVGIITEGDFLRRAETGTER